MDANQLIKAQIGELVWNTAILMAEIDRLKKELEAKNVPDVQQ